MLNLVTDRVDYGIQAILLPSTVTETLEYFKFILNIKSTLLQYILMKKYSIYLL